MLACGLDLSVDGLAVACGSHAGQPVHTAAVRELLAAFGLDAGALQNTPTRPLDRTTAEGHIRSGVGPTALYQNCSGKHAAMLATCVVNGWRLDSYLDPGHPLQQAIEQWIGRAAGGVEHSGIDGCGAPTPMTSLRGLAEAFRALALERSAAYRAMTARPDLVAGDKREDTLLMRAVPGLVSKGGAEAIGVVTLGDGRTIAMKVADGSERARLPVMLALLDRLGVEVPTDSVLVPPILGHGRPVGATVSLLP
jgi:L-asparaginase II